MAYDGYEEYHGPLTPHEQRERVWSAYSAGYMFRIKSDPDIDPVSPQMLAGMLEKLGETEMPMDGNTAWRSRLLEAYAGGVNYWRRLAGEAEVEADP